MAWLNWPNRLTIARIVLVGPLVAGLLQINSNWVGWRRLVLALFVLMALTDALDGFLARRLGEGTPLGRFLDPVADKLLVICAVVLLAIDTTAVPGFKLPNWVPVFAVGKDILVVIGFGLLYATTGEFFIRPRIWGKACTAVQLAMVAFCLIAPDLDRVVGRIPTMFAGLYWTATLLAVVALGDYMIVGNRFAARHHQLSQRTPSDE